MTAEMTALNENDTFELVKPPRDRQIIGGGGNGYLQSKQAQTGKKPTKLVM